MSPYSLSENAITVHQAISPAAHTTAKTAVMLVFLSLPFVRAIGCIEISILSFFGEDCAAMARQRPRHGR